MAGMADGMVSRKLAALVKQAAAVTGSRQVRVKVSIREEGRFWF